MGIPLFERRTSRLSGVTHMTFYGQPGVCITYTHEWYPALMLHEATGRPGPPDRVVPPQLSSSAILATAQGSAGRVGGRTPSGAPRAVCRLVTSEGPSAGRRRDRMLLRETGGPRHTNEREEDAMQIAFSNVRPWSSTLRRVSARTSSKRWHGPGTGADVSGRSRDGMSDRIPALCVLPLDELVSPARRHQHGAGSVAPRRGAEGASTCG